MTKTDEIKARLDAIKDKDQELLFPGNEDDNECEYCKGILARCAAGARDGE